VNATDWILDVVARNAQRTFLVDARGGETLTFGALHEAARRVAADLDRRGLERGDRVAFIAHNSIALATAYFGCLYAGVVAVPVNPVLAAPEVEHILRTSGARLLVVGGSAAGAARHAGDVGVVLLADGTAPATPADAAAIEPWDLAALAPTDRAPLDGVGPDDPLCLVFTSGTTGMPSAVGHTIADLVDNARLFSAALRIGPEHRFYGVLAMTYLGGYYNLLLLPFVAGASVAVADAFDARSALDFWTPAQRAGVTALWLVPTIGSILLELDRGEEGARFCREHVALTLVGTAPLPASLRERIEDRYGLVLHENYALSETLFLTSSTPDDPAPPGTTGRPLPGIDVRIAGGEVEVRTPFQSGGGGGRATAWFATGDLGALDADGRLRITGRSKDIIIRGGVNVSPAAAEDVLLAHPAVVECAVVGVPHPHYGEDSVAAVRLADGADPAAVRAELAALCRERLGATNRPARIVVLADFPRSSGGKIQKRHIRELVAP
jgi:acyl-CoA synthetase (AMP-forming)/AMP-acid ligase II